MDADTSPVNSMLFMTVLKFNSFVEAFSIRRKFKRSRTLPLRANDYLLILSIIVIVNVSPVYLQTTSTTNLTASFCNVTCLDTRLSACLPKTRLSEVMLGISEKFVCHRSKDCYGGGSTTTVPVQQKPVNILFGQAIQFRLDQSIASSPSLYWQMYNVTAEQFRTCNYNTDRKNLLGNITQNSYMYLNSTLFGSGTHYFAGVANNLLACHLGLRITITVKNHDCAVSEDLRSVCNSKGKCIENSNDSTAFCQCCKGFNGRYCTEYNACVTEPCLNAGNCSDIIAGHGNNFTCSCTPFYTGKRCETKIDYCSSSPCLNNGTCLNQVLQGNYTCNCMAGFTGKHCELNINECLSHNCSNNSTCVDKVNGFQCICQGNWTGKYCSEDINECNFINCQNGGTCTNIPGSFYCDCPLNTTGRLCEVDLYDNCASNPCLNKGICTDLIGGFSCKCPQGFTGSNCSTDIDECASNPCSVQGTSACLNGPGNYSCVCLSEYTGKRCEQFLNKCTSQPCLNGGLCVNLYGQYECVCPAGYRGKNCQEVLNKCSFKPCKNNGTCIRSNDYLSNYTCSCKPGWTGRNCTQDFNECNSNPCLNGASCVNLFNKFSCICDIGWNGTRCENNINACESFPCKNGATCTDLITKLDYTCTCVSGFTGKNCSVNIDDCVRLKANCNNGICIDQQGSYYCNCSSGWYGNYCNTNRDMCAKNYCQNSATCENVNTTSGYVCTCKAGWTGFNCSVNINDCALNPCRNGGVCNDYLNFYNCSCPQGYSGRHCEFDINECLSQPCQNNGTCFDQIGKFNCICLKGFDGTRCETNINECASSPCFNNATCVDGINQYSCQCQGGYTGIHCEIPKCHTNPCRNGALCLQQPDKFVCQCLPGFSGLVCETQINECLSDPCQNNGSCIDQVNGYRCNCVNGFTSTHCETHLCDMNVCKNGAACARINTGYVCSCLDGYTGPTCSESINECLSNPCNLTGAINCTDIVAGYKCFCRGGYTGILCNTHVCDAQNPCLNGATCVRLPDTYQCQCLPGFQGPNCENNTNECLSNPCNSGSCIDGINGYTCNCSSTYTGLHCETNLDKCSSSPCLNNGNCSNVIESLSFKCACTGGYIGNRCQSHLCDVIKPCKNNATCLKLPNGYSCQCLGGYTGQNCSQDINECTSLPCQNGGVCQNKQNSFSCLCPQNFTGQQCETFLDYCSPNPCNTGSCSNDYIHKTFNCSCPPAFFGRQCETHICDINNPCQNGATCIRNATKATCKCLPGFTGQNCTSDILECASNPCQNNGTCVEALNSYSCNCYPEFTGIRCETPADYCSGNPCRNSGTCVNDFPNRTYKCICQPYATGTNCEVYVGPCYSNPCRNNGTCTETAGYSYRCSCTLGYTGAQCKDITCPCLNSGRCVSNGGKVQCLCQNGYGGSLCESYYGDCRNNASLKCLFDSYCKQTMYGYTCQCPGHLSGSTTCKLISTCSPSPCLNNAGCTLSSTGSLTCNCIPGFTGQFCQFNMNECLPNPCQNGGKCREVGVNNFECFCAAGYFGRLCVNKTSSSSLSSKVIYSTPQYIASSNSRLQSTAIKQLSITQTSITSSLTIKLTTQLFTSINVNSMTSSVETMSASIPATSVRQSSYLTSNILQSTTFASIRVSIQKSASSIPTDQSFKPQSSTFYSSKYGVRSSDLTSSVKTSTALVKPSFFRTLTVQSSRFSYTLVRTNVEFTSSMTLHQSFSGSLVTTLTRYTSVQPGARSTTLHSEFISSSKVSSSEIQFPTTKLSSVSSVVQKSSIIEPRSRDPVSISSTYTFLQPYRSLTTSADLQTSNIERKFTSVTVRVSKYSHSYSETLFSSPSIFISASSSAVRSVMHTSSYPEARKSTIYVQKTTDLHSTGSSLQHDSSIHVLSSHTSDMKSSVYASVQPSSSIMQHPLTTSYDMSSQAVRSTPGISTFLLPPATSSSLIKKQETTSYSSFSETTTTASSSSITSASRSSITNASRSSTTTASSSSITTASRSSITTASRSSITIASRSSITTASRSSITTASRSSITTASRSSITTASRSSITTASRSSITTASRSSITTASRSSITTASRSSITTASRSSITTASRSRITTASRSSITASSRSSITTASRSSITSTAASISVGKYSVSVHTYGVASYKSQLDSSYQKPKTTHTASQTIATKSSASVSYYKESSSFQGYSSSRSKLLTSVYQITSEMSSTQRHSISFPAPVFSSATQPVTVIRTSTPSAALSPSSSSIYYNPCFPNPCLQGAVCSISSLSSFNCTCLIGYGGRICESLACQCKNSGRCVKGSSSEQYHCVCNVGFTGTLCENQISDCRVNNCSGKGICRERLQGFVCACDSGYYGDRCQNMSNVCQPNLCNNGICVTRSNATGGGFTCVCRPGYQGQFCNFDYNECASSPCLNGGTCREDAINSYRCYCPSWSNGTNCEILLTTSLSSQSSTSSQLYISTLPSLNVFSTTILQSDYTHRVSSQAQMSTGSFGVSISPSKLQISPVSSINTKHSPSVISISPQVSKESTIKETTLITTASLVTYTTSCTGDSCPQLSSISRQSMPSYMQSTSDQSAYGTLLQRSSHEIRYSISATETRSTFMQSSLTAKGSSVSNFSIVPVSASSLLYPTFSYRTSANMITDELRSPLSTIDTSSPVSSSSKAITISRPPGSSTRTSSALSEHSSISTKTSHSPHQLYTTSSSTHFASKLSILSSQESFSSVLQSTGAASSKISTLKSLFPYQSSSLFPSSSEKRLQSSYSQSSTTRAHLSSYITSSSTAHQVSLEKTHISKSSAVQSSSALQSSAIPTIIPTTIPLKNLTCADNVCNGFPCFNESNNGMQFRCSCPYPTFGPRCIQGITIHFPLFNGYTYANYASIPFLDVINTIVMTFRTTKTEGLLLYAGHQTFEDFIMLRIVDGFVEFRFDAGAEVIFIRSLGIVNTGSLVTLVAKHDSRSGTGTLTVNNDAPISRSTTASFRSVQLSTAWYLGGAPSTFHPVNISNSVPTFVNLVGCIKDLQVNNKPYRILNAQSWHSIGECDVAACQRGPCRNNATCIQNEANSQQYTCKCGTGYLGRDCTEMEAHCQGDPCNGGTCVWTPTGHICLCQYGRHGTSCLNAINITAPTFNQVYNYSSYIEYSWRQTMKSAAERFEIRMQFKLSSGDAKSFQNGIFAYAAQSTIGATGDDFFVLGIINNHTYLLYNLGGGLTTIRSVRPIDSTRTWHLIIAGRTGGAGYMYIDDQPVVRATSPGVLVGLDAYTPLYIGGVPDLSKLPSIVRAYFYSGFIGVLYDVSFRTTGTGFKQLLTNSTGNAIPGVQGVAVERGLNIGDNQVNDCQPNPCKNNGTCFQKGGQFVCTCVSGWTGIICQDKRIPCIDYNPCSAGSICRSETTGIVCDCPLGKTGTYCDKVVKIVQPYFKKNSFMGFTKPPVKYITKVFLRFKASKTDGLLFYVSEKVDSSSGDYFAISLWQGYAYVRFNLGLGMTTMRTRKQIVINQWHTIYVERRYKEAIMRLDSNPLIGCRSSGTYTQLNVGSILYLGGLPLLSALNPTAVKDVSSQKDFEGCVSHFTVNDVIKVLNSTKAVVGRNIDDCTSNCILNQCKNGAVCSIQATNKQYPYSCSCTLGWQGLLCDQAIPPYNRAKFSGDGYIFYQESITTPQFTNHIEFSFNTTSDGLILWFGQLRTNKIDYLAIGVKNSKVKLSFDTGSGVTEVISTHNVTDGKLHKVTVRRDGLSKTLLFIVNGYMPILRGVTSTDQALDNNGHFYVGGLDGDVKTLTKGQYNSGLNGCVWDVKVQLSNAVLNLNKIAANRGLNVKPCE